MRTLPRVVRWIGLGASRRVPAAALLALLALSAAGQETGGGEARPAAASRIPLSQHVHDRWTQRDGLPHNVVETVLVSRSGYLWLGTQEGLVRFDGARFAVVDRAASAGLAGDQIQALCEDAAGDLWIGTSAGLSRLRRGTFEQVATGGPPAEAVHLIVRDGDDLWASAATGLRRYRAGAWTAVGPAWTTLEQRVSALAPARGGGVWLGGMGWIGRMRDGVTEPLPAGLPPSERVSALLEDAGGTLWAGTSRGLARRAPGAAAFTQVRGIDAVEIRSLTSAHDREVWASTSSGLLRVAGDEVEPVPGLIGSVNGALVDADGSIWFGTGTDGLHRLRLGTVRTLSPAEGLSSRAVWAVAASADGSVLVAGDSGLDRVTGDRPTPVLPEVLAGLGLTGLLEDRAGQLWIGTDTRGVLRAGRGGVRWYGAAEGLTSQPRALLQDAAGSVWVGARDGLYRLRGERFELLAASPGPVSALLEGPAGALWVGTSVGLLRREGSRLEPIPLAAAGEPVDVTALLLDPDGTLWVGTVGSGLWVLRDGRARRLTRREGLHENTVFAVADDGRGHLWLSGNHGLTRVARADVEHVVAGAVATLAASALGRGDGMLESECSGGVQPSSARSADGRLWFPTINGVVVVDPARVLPTPEPPRLVFEEVIVDGARQPLEASLLLPPGTRRVEIRYTAAALAGADRVRFRHRLLGIDPTFVDVGSERAVHYAGLGPGRYLFELSAANASGVWSAAPATLSFEIAPRFWQTNGFAALVVVALALLGFVVVQLRTRQLRAQQLALAHRVEEEAAKVKALTGLVPVCAWCRRIRDQEGSWLSLERFISRSQKAEVTHALCPDCFRKQEEGFPGEPP